MGGGFDALVVFLREPRPGTVKTRLAAAVGAEAAAALYRALAEAEIRATVPRRGEYERLFFFDPPGARAALERWWPGEVLLAQAGADLGLRMAAAFAEAFRRGARRAAILGTDVPWASREDVLEALESLDDHDLAIGPATDGGYWILALDRPRPELFRGIAWSTPSVFVSTVERAGAFGLGVRVLRMLPDVDTADDLRAHWGRLRGLLPPDLAAAVGALIAR